MNLAEVGRLDFEEVSPEKYSCLFLALDALELGGGAPAALNGANEEVVAAYLNGAFPFLNISEMLHRVMAGLKAVLASNEAPPCLARIDTVDDALAADRWGREAAQRLIAN